MCTSRLVVQNLQHGTKLHECRRHFNSLWLCGTAAKKTCAPVNCFRATQRIPCKNPCSWNVIPMCRQSSCRKHGGCFYPSLRLDLLPMFKYMGLEGGCVALTIWRVQYWREMLLPLASAAGGRARGGCSDVSCRAQLRKIQLRCGIFRCDLSGCSSRFV